MCVCVCVYVRAQESKVKKMLDFNGDGKVDGKDFACVPLPFAP